MNRRNGLAVLLTALFLPLAAHAQVLTFEGLTSPASPFASIGNFYNGGAGPNFGIQVSDGGFAICLNTLTQDCGSGASRGGQGDPSSQEGALALFETSASLSSTPGFINGFSFFYSAVNFTGLFSVFSGLDGTGTLLASLTLATTPIGPCVGYLGDFCPFVPASVNFSGTAHSIVLAGVPGQLAIDDLAFTTEQTTTTPEPTSMLLLATGLAGAGVVSRRRRKRVA